MEEPFEPVHEVGASIDRPLEGTAEFNGALHRFCLLGWESPPTEVLTTWDVFEPWLFRHWDPAEDRYELVPTAAPIRSAVWARATFCGTEPALRVSWRPVSVVERFTRITEAQPWGGPPGCILGVPSPAYICVRFWLCESDWEEFRTERDRGEAMRYESFPVFPLSSSPEERGEWGWFQGVWFEYVPCLCVD